MIDVESTSCTHAGVWPVERGACGRCFSDLHDEVERLRSCIDAALALHKHVECYVDEMGDKHLTSDWWCSCGHGLPCPTVKALRGEEE